MRHRIERWTTLLLAGLFVLSILVLPSLGVGREAEAAAKYRYDPNKAISSASAILDQYVQENKSSQGARYVSAVLRAGGLAPVDEGGAGNLIACLNTPSKFGGVIGKVIADPTSNDLRPGDVLAVVCSKGSTSATYAGAHGQGSSFWGIQDHFVSKVNSNNTVEVYSYKGKNLGGRYHETVDLKTFAKNSFTCGKCGNGSNLHLIAFAFTQTASCKVTFNANGGMVDTGSKTVTSGYTCGTLPTPTRAGWRFVGWFTAKKGGSLVTSGTVITQDTVLFAQWVRIKTYQVTFNGNGGKSSLNRKPVPGGDTLGTLPTATRRGYIFAGWYTAKVGGEQVSSSTMVTGKMTVFAHWEPIYYTFDINATLDGAGRSNLEGVGAVDVYINGRLVARNVTEYKTALPYGTKYRIKVRPVNGMKSRGAQKGSRLSGTVMGYTEVVLRFETVTYVVRFQGNGGRTPTAQANVKGGQTIRDLPTPTRNGYDFVGWYTAKNGGTRVTEQTIITGKITLFAHWEKQTGTTRYAPYAEVLFNHDLDYQNESDTIAKSWLPRYFALEDLNGDGINELIVLRKYDSNSFTSMAWQKVSLSHIYTLSNGTAVLIYDDGQKYTDDLYCEYSQAGGFALDGNTIVTTYEDSLGYTDFCFLKYTGSKAFSVSGYYFYYSNDDNGFKKYSYTLNNGSRRNYRESWLENHGNGDVYDKIESECMARLTMPLIYENTPQNRQKLLGSDGDPCGY